MDYNQRDVEQLRCDSIVMENLQDMQLDQVGRDKFKYLDVATEAIANPAQQANLLNKLFKDIQKVEQIDFAKIPDSKGDLTKYAYYDAMNDCMEVINKLTLGNETPNVVTMNKLHKILLDGRNDFTFGFRAQNYIVTNTYNLMVRSLYEMINVCVVDCTDYLRAKLTMKVSSPTAKQIRWITKSANQFIKMYESGQWSMLMKHYKSQGRSVIAGMESTMPATEGIGDLLAAANAAPGLIQNGETLINTAMKTPDMARNAWDKTKTFIGSIPTSIKIVGIIVGLFFIMRKLIYLFIHSMHNIKQCIKDQSEIVKASIANDTDDSSIEKQRKLLDRMEKTADAIDYRILKSEQAAQKDLQQSNRSTFSSSELQNISGSDFEL